MHLPNSLQCLPRRSLSRHSRCFGNEFVRAYTRQVITPGEPASPSPGISRTDGRGFQNSIRAALMFALALAMILWYSIDAVQQMRHREALRRYGIETTGEITRLWTSGHGFYRKVSYTFTVNGGVFTGQAQAPKDSWDSLQNADSLSVRYIPENPAINHPGGWEWSALQRLDLLVAGILSAVFAVFLLFDRSPTRRLAA